MSMISFDALKLARRLREAGMPSEQAEAVAEAEAEALGEFIQSHLATKQDIAGLKQEIGICRSDLKEEITSVRSELKQDIADLRQEIGDCRSELKQDIADLRSELKQDIADLRSELKQEIAEVRIEVASVRTELIRWMGAFMVAQVGLIVGLLKLIG